MKPMELVLRRAVLTAMVLTCATGLFAQRVVIKSVVDSKPIQNVHVFDHSGNISELTDNYGRVSIDKFGDADTLYLRHPGFEEERISKQQIIKQNYEHFMISLVVQMPEFVLTSAKNPEYSPSPLKIHTIDARKNAIYTPATTADMLQMAGGVSVQRSQLGGGSPVLRGFEANKVLLVVDGVRLNNAIYRSGHLQNAITVDNNSLEKTDIIFGPGSVVYGSDAIGGVIHFRTRTPELLTDDNKRTSVNTFIRHATAAQENSAHADVEVRFKKWATYTSITGSSFGDLRTGTKRSHGYADLGVQHYYVADALLDTFSTVNADTLVHRNTGYNQVDLLQKIVFKPGEKSTFIANAQYSTSSVVPRYDQMNNVIGNANEYAEWSYGPQKRLLGSLELQMKDKSRLFDYGSLVLSFQRVNEDRHNRRLISTSRTNRFEEVGVVSFTGDFSKKIDSSATLFYGIELSRNTVSSTANNTDIFTEIVSPAITRYPDGGSTMGTFGLYSTYRKLLGEKTTLNLGVRYSHISLQSDFIDNTFYNLPFTTIDFGNGAGTGSASLAYRPHKTWKLSGILSSGFRSPNVDDYGKVREKDGFVDVPNDQLKPEYAYNAELGISKLLDKDILLELNGYYTRLRNAIVKKDYTLNGQDSLLIDGEMARIQTNMNAAAAEVYGLTGRVNAAITNELGFEMGVTFTKGNNITDSVPLAHIPPFYGKTGLNYVNEKWEHSLYVLYNGWKKIEDYGPGSTDNPFEATADGAPAWHTFNYKVSYTTGSGLMLQLGLENIFDVHYKPFASGISGPGRNLILTLRYRM